MIEVVSLKFGAAFKKAFGHEDVFCKFVHDILGINVTIERVHEEYAYPEQIGLVAIRYDLFADVPRKRIIVEIQHAKHADFLDRFLHYHLCGIVEQAKDHAHYALDKAVYTIVVLTTVPRVEKRLQCSEIITEFSSVNEYDNKVELYPHKLIFLNPNLANDKTPPAARGWLELIKDSLDGTIDETRFPSQEMQKVIKEITSAKISPELLAQIKDEAAWEKSKKDVREEGKQEKQIEIAKNMLKEKMDISIIAKITGLTVEEISQIRSDL